MRVPVFGVIGSRWGVVRGNGLACRSSESVRVVCPRWHAGALEIIGHVRAEATRRSIQVRRPVTRVPIGIVVRIVGGHAVVTSLCCRIKDRVNRAIVKPYEAGT